MERVREQVDTFVAYGGYQKGMNVGQILDGSRADRLILKELEKNTSGIISDLTSGKAKNTIISLPNIDWQSEKYKITSNAAEVASTIEKSFKLTY